MRKLTVRLPVETEINVRFEKGPRVGLSIKQMARRDALRMIAPEGRQMATILEFRTSRPHAPPMPVTTRSPAPAEIVIFPGIRYEYRAEPQLEQVPAAKSMVKRRGKCDVIET